jgi:hypothetical protein
MGAPPGRTPTSAADLQASFPPEMLQRAQPQLVAEALAGRVSLEELAAIIGAPLFPAGSADELAAAAMNTPLYQKQFITHWLTHYYVIQGTIDEDRVGEAGIDGRCSNQKMTDAAAAPSLDLNYWTDSQGRVLTYTWNAYYDYVENPTGYCYDYDYTDLTRYFVTWIFAPTARSGQVWLGAHDYFKLWVNGALVLQRTSGGARTYTADEYKAPVNLRQGWNLLAFKHAFPKLGPYTSSNPDDVTKAFSLRFVSDAAGTPMTDLQAAFDPNCTDTSSSAGIYSRVWAPNIAKLAGSGGSQWRTFLSVFNGWHMPWRHLFHYFKEGANGGTPNVARALVVGPYRTEVFDNALESLFGVTADEKGYFLVFHQYYNFYYWRNSYRWLQLKVYNQASSGTFGMEVPLLYYYDTSSTSRFASVPGGQGRVNLGYIPRHGTGARTSLRVTAVPEGTATQVSKTYGPFTGYFQINDVLTDMGLTPAQAANVGLWAQLVSPETTTHYFAYITINDGIPAQGKPGTSDPLMRLPSAFANLPPTLQ